MGRKFKLTTYTKEIMADTITPVSIYLQMRDKYANSFLLESSDYHSYENSFSYICCDVLSSFKVERNEVKIQWPDKSEENFVVDQLVSQLQDYRDSFEVEKSHAPYIQNGLFGYTSYNAVKYFEDIELNNSDTLIPEVLYNLFRYIIAVDHFKNRLYVFEHVPEGDKSNLDQFMSLIRFGSYPSYSFKISGEESSNMTDGEFIQVVKNCISHCKRGDVFQIVPSRRYQNEFSGDDFNVYRALRSINPSPYLFYFDYGNFRIFGSSPEAQIIIKEGEASIHPIAGTFKRTGDDEADRKIADQLVDDEKENAEHVMLVDLARNDLSINSDDVSVDVFKEIQYFSHVIHLVSKVTGKLKEGVIPLQLVADTFPAGTLSGAPKHMAMNLIDQQENTARDYYGGAIGFMGFNDDFNHAIMIRSFISMDYKLIYQAGAGVVSKSEPEKELQEVNNKLQALRNAMEMAEGIDN